MYFGGMAGENQKVPPSDVGFHKFHSTPRRARPVPGVKHVTATTTSWRANSLPAQSGQLDREDMLQPTMANDLHRRMADVIQKYSSGFIPHISISAGARQGHGSLAQSNNRQLEEYHVALTGATGNVGCIMCHLLIEDPNVRTVYLLNRRNGSPAKERIGEAFREKGFDPNVLDTSITRIIYLEIDFSKKKLGLNETEYTNVSNFQYSLSPRCYSFFDNTP